MKQKMEDAKIGNPVFKVLSKYSPKKVAEIVELTWKSVREEEDIERKELCGLNVGGGYGSNKNIKKRRSDDDGDAHSQPLEKKRQIDPTITCLINSLKNQIHPFLEKSRPPKLQNISFDEAVAHLHESLSNSKPNSKPNAKKSKKNPNLKLRGTQSAGTKKISSSSPSSLSKATAWVAVGCRGRTPKFPAASASVRRIKVKASKLDSNPQPKPKPSLSNYSQAAIPIPIPDTTSQQNPVAEISPNRALRAAQLRNRFAGTILRAQRHPLFNSVGANTLPHKEEAAAAAAAVQLKMIREKEREAARIALNNVEKAADGKDNLEMFEELQALCACPLSYHEQDHDKRPYPLHLLGLSLKQ